MRGDGKYKIRTDLASFVTFFIYNIYKVYLTNQKRIYIFNSKFNVIKKIIKDVFMKNRTMKIISTIFIITIVLLVIIQFIPYGKDHTNPPVISVPNWDSQQTHDLAKRACFDCHSNETVWPWYSNIAPVSWLVYRDVVEGRSRLNFSDWQNTRLQESGELTSIINEGEMPPFQYLLMHRSAKLSPTEKTDLINGLQKTLGQ
jgi:hypothetical protein